MKKVNLAVVGATGMVGRTFLKVLKERNFPIENLYLMASKRSAGSVVEYDGKEYVVEELTEHSFDKPIDIALFSAGGSTSEKYHYESQCAGKNSHEITWADVERMHLEACKKCVLK